MLFPPQAGWGEQGVEATVEGGTGIPLKKKMRSEVTSFLEAYASRGYYIKRK